MGPREQLVLEGGLVLGGPAWLARRADLLVEGQQLVAVEEPGTFATLDARRTDLSGCLVLPGLVNAHMHSHNMVARGVARDWTLEASLLHGPWMGARRSAELASSCALLAGAESLASGAVGVFDLVSLGALPDPELLAAVGESYARLGIRARLAPMVADRTVHEAVPVIGACCGSGPQAASAEVIVDACATVLALGAVAEGVDLALAPTIPTHCSRELMADLRRLADDHGVPIHLHLAESLAQAMSGLERYGRSITAELAAIGMLEGPLTAAHAVWVDDADIDLLAGAGVRVVTVPGSNLRLGSGVAPVHRLVRAGVSVGVGTDGANSSDLLDVLDAVRLTALVSRLASPDPIEWLSVEATLEAATVGGARACGWSDTGRLAPGMRADLTVVDLSGPGFSPLNDPANQLLTAARAADVRHVMSGGTFRLEERRVHGVDLAAARSRHRELTEAFLADVRELRARADREVAASSNALVRLRRRAPHPDRGAHGTVSPSG